MLEVAADTLAFPHGDVASHQERGDETAANGRCRVDLLLEQLDQDRRTLRVPDEHDAATVVVVSQVVAEARAHAVVGDPRVSER